MKSASKYNEMEDMVPGTRLGTTASPGKPAPSPSTVIPDTKVLFLRRAIAGGSLALGASFTIALFSVAGMAGDSATCLVAWGMALLDAGIALAIALSRLAAFTMVKIGATPLENAISPACERKWSWKAVPIDVRLNHRFIIRALKQHPAVRYRYAIELRAVKFQPFTKRSNLQSRVLIALGFKTEAERAAWYASRDGGWKVGFRAGISAEDTAAAGASADIMAATLSGHFTGFGFERAGRSRCLGYFMGDELAVDATIPKEIAPDVPVGTAVETHAPVTIKNDVVIGKVVEPESLAAIADAGIRFEHFRGGCCIAGGKTAERVTLLKILLSTPNPFTTIIIDDHGDYHIPGSRVLLLGSDIELNPMIPAASNIGGSMHYANLFVAALAAIHGFSSDQETFLASRLGEALKTSVTANLLPKIGDLVDQLAFDAKSMPEHSVAAALARDFKGWAEPWYSITDAPALDDTFLAHRATVIDLSAASGAEKRAFKAILMLKLQSLVENSTMTKPVLLVVPDIDKVFYDERVEKPSPRVAQGVGKVIGTIARGSSYFIISAQDPAKLPDSVLGHISTVVVFRLGQGQARETMASTLGLEDEQLYEHSRHASYQRRYMSEMPDGTCYLKRPDVATAFLVAVDASLAAAVPRTKSTATPQATIRVDLDHSLLESALADLGPVKHEVIAVLTAMKQSGNQGVKEDWMKDLIAEKCKEAIAKREPRLAQKDVIARSKAMAQRAVDVLNQRRMLAEDGYNPSGLKKGVTTRLTQFGEAAVDRAASSLPVMDTATQAILDTEQAISEQYPGGDLAELGERVMAAAASLFQDLKRRGKLASVAELLGCSGAHARQLATSIENYDNEAIARDIVPVINDFRAVVAVVRGGA
nr:hypothetical protein [Candidatus Sigynarchaeota archaeon]